MKTIDKLELYQRLAEILDQEEVKPENISKTLTDGIRWQSFRPGDG